MVACVELGFRERDADAMRKALRAAEAGVDADAGFGEVEGALVRRADVDAVEREFGVAPDARAVDQAR